MDVNCTSYLRRASLVLAAALLGFVGASPASSSQFNPSYFTGGGFGPTAEVAIQSAIWDAEATASYFQLYQCQLVGEILIFARANARFGRNFNAEVTVACAS